jgi:GNAT superfamily N-acetyltransferase
MRFELTEALIDDILFSMEDQEGEFLIDTVEGIVIGGIEGPEYDENYSEYDNDRYIDLPDWDSSDGFRLMERFAAGFRNPLIRNELSAALGNGRGVFRAYKNVLGRYPEAEKLWFAFKEKEMKREIIIWYNGLREEWGLEKIGTEPEETGDLVLEDFRFRPFRKDDLDKAGELHSCCLEEYKKMIVERGAKNPVEVLLRESQAFQHSKDLLFGGDPAICAETGGGEFAGYISGFIKDSELYVQSLEVKAEYRGLGIGEALLVRFLESQDTGKVSHALFDLPFWAEGFSRVLLREAFNPYSVRYWLNLRDRES